MSVCPVGLAIVMIACGAPPAKQDAPLKTAAAVLDNYKLALGGPGAIQSVHSLTVRGEVESSGQSGKSSFIYYAKQGEFLLRITRPDGSQVSSGFEGSVSWSLSPEGATIDKAVAIDSVRRDADLLHALHETDYFQKLELAGVTDFDGRPCYWLRGVTSWGKAGSQYYDVKTGLLAGDRFQSDDPGGGDTTEVYQDYRSFAGPLTATRRTSHSGDRTQTFTFESVTYSDLPDELFELPPAVRAQLHPCPGPHSPRRHARSL